MATRSEPTIEPASVSTSASAEAAALALDEKEHDDLSHVVPAAFIDDARPADMDVDTGITTSRPTTAVSTQSLHDLDLPLHLDLPLQQRRAGAAKMGKRRKQDSSDGKKVLALDADNVSLIPLSPLTPSGDPLQRMLDTAGPNGEPMTAEVRSALPENMEVDGLPLVVHRVSRGKGLLMLIKSFVGAGILFLPNAFRIGGMAFSSVMVVLMGYLSLEAMWLLVDVQEHLEAKVGPDPYFTKERRVRIEKGDFAGVGRFVVSRRFGDNYAKWAETAVDVALALSQFGFCCTTFIFFASNCAPIISASTAWHPTIDQLIFIQLLFYIPAALLRQLAKISFLAIFADVFILFGLVGVLYYDVRTIAAQGTAHNIAAFTTSWPLFLGTVVYAFEGIGLVLPLRASLERREVYPGMLAITVVITGVLMLLIAILSYLAFGEKTEIIIFDSLPDSSLVHSMQVVYSFAMMFTVPMTMYPGIMILEKYIMPTFANASLSKKNSIQNLIRVLPPVILGVLASVFRSHLDFFISVVGSLCCGPLLFVFPAIFHWSIAETHRERVKDVVIGVIGMSITIFVSALTLYDAMT